MAQRPYECGGARRVGSWQQAGRQIEQGVPQMDIPSRGNGNVEQIGGHHRDSRRKKGGKNQLAQLLTVIHGNSSLPDGIVPVFYLPFDLL